MQETLHTAVVAVILLLSATAADAQGCQGRKELWIPQESYLALTDRVYAYAGPIQRQGQSGWRPFTVQVLVGQYRRPFLLPKGLLREADVNKLLAQRSDVTRIPLRVAGHDPAGGKKPSFPAVDVTGAGRPLTVRVFRVQPSSNAVGLEVCGL